MIVYIFLLFLGVAFYFLWKDFRERKPVAKSSQVTVSPRVVSRRSNSSLSWEKTGLYQGDILEELASTTLHILFGVMSGVGRVRV